MTVTFGGVSATQLFRNSLWKMRVCGVEEESRNGPVLVIQEPVVFELYNPLKRVLIDSKRNANPFFHVMEFVWMMAGSNDIQWIAQFNKQMLAYSDDGKTQYAAYGHRWRKHFGIEQIKKAIVTLRRNTKDRRVVIGMWDPLTDLGHTGRDVPCNTQIYLRIRSNLLDMTVTNRSNDLIWGAMGANLVHMTFLQELIADSLGIPCGEYAVFTNNLHIYESVPNFDYYMSGVYEERDIYNGEARKHVPLLQRGETYSQFVEDCEKFVAGNGIQDFKTQWITDVAIHVFNAWKTRSLEDLARIEDDAWRIACSEWVSRKSTSVGNKQLDNYTRVARRQQESQGVGDSPIQSAAVADVGSCESNVGTDSTESSSNCDVSP